MTLKTADSSLDECMGPYLRDWLKIAREKTVLEQKIIDSEEFYVPFAGAEKRMINAIFAISKSLQIESSKYMAVHLVDRYLAKFFWESISSSDSTETAVENVRKKMSGRFNLILATCIQIASKVDCFSTALDIPQIQNLLGDLDPDTVYSKAEIKSWEIKILKKLDFRLPFCLPIDVVGILLQYTELSSASTNLLSVCRKLIDVAYLKHEKIFCQLHLMARGEDYDRSKIDSKRFLKMEMNAGFVAASVVVCSIFFCRIKKKVVESVIAKVSALIDVNPIDVKIMANIIFTNAVDEEDFRREVERRQKSKAT